VESLDLLLRHGSDSIPDPKRHELSTFLTKADRTNNDPGDDDYVQYSNAIHTVWNMIYPDDEKARAKARNLRDSHLESLRRLADDAIDHTKDEESASIHRFLNEYLPYNPIDTPTRETLNNWISVTRNSLNQELQEHVDALTRLMDISLAHEKETDQSRGTDM
jgi:hypothetical protein